jgi:C4-dicarboxylate transporter DctM subunit
MSPEVIGLLGILILLVLIFLRMWVAFCMAIVGFFGIAAIQGFPQALHIAGNVPFTFIFKYVMTTIPMFVLMGNAIAETGIGTDLYYAANKWLGSMRGGLAIATNVACAFLAAITGVANVALITMGKVALPEMRKQGYSDRLSAACIACSGTLAVLIPPSIPFILYGIITELSIGKLYMAGIVPGLILTLFFAFAIWLTAKLNPKLGPAGPRTTFREKIVSLKGIWMTMVLFILVIGGIYGGIFTPTEAGAVGAFGALAIGFATRRFKRQSVVRMMVDTSLMTSMVLLLMMGVSIFIRFVAISKLPFLLSEFIGGLSVSPLVILMGIIVLYILLGMFTDILASVLLTVPILYPIILNLGFDPIWFGVLVVMLVQMGLVTPPIGMDVYVLGGITGVPVGTIFRGIIPFVIAIVVMIALIIAFPQIVLFLPNSM